MLNYIKKYLLLDEDIVTYIEQLHKIIPRKDALLITVIYGVFGLLWILLSDRLLALLL
ncbi:hypothetical protein KHA80_05315 [Anaerobacillus sp. HL2]|nr:hypothetical protein KHA80_05315 [Anaerobacillus sp. HL2]